MVGPSNKRLRREEYRLAQQKGGLENGTRLELPKKKFFRQRAHANPFSDHALTYPAAPNDMDWTTHFPAFSNPSPEQGHPKCLIREVEIADIGCGFGGLLVALSPLFPDTLMIGMELRTQVTDFVISKVAALRSQNPWTGHERILPPYHNISALRTNTMKFMPNFFNQSQLSKVFLCFPDPQFKQRKHKARIISAQLNSEYAYVVKPSGKVYTITDVEELHEWMVNHFIGDEAGDASELWERVTEEALSSDPCVKIMSNETEEAKKVTRNGGNKYVAVFRRRENPGWPE